MRLFGVCNHTVLDVMRWKSNKRYVHISRLADIRQKKTLLITDANLVLSNLSTLNRLPAVCILFSGPLRLATMQGVHLLDLTFEHAPPFYGIKVRSELNEDVWDSAEEKRISVCPIDYTRSIILHVESTSILTDFMTIIYSLPSSTHQKPVKVILLHWLYKNGSSESLDRVLSKISSSLTLSSRNVERIKSLLNSPISHRVKKALAQVRKKEAVEKVASVNNVSAYDLRYILSIVNDTVTDFERSVIAKI